LLGDFHLATVKRVAIGSDGQHFWCPEVDHGINGLDIVLLHVLQSVWLRGGPVKPKSILDVGHLDGIDPSAQFRFDVLTKCFWRGG